ncbi:MAG: trehalase family glycosidase [Candidatus Caenarcaniphilales bacterium]|nr:trehalase family glycosidase [Candidatus Caenarcaniphilales bacterium]
MVASIKSNTIKQNAKSLESEVIKGTSVAVSKYIEDNIEKLILKKQGLLLYDGITPSLVRDQVFDTDKRILTGVYSDKYDWDAYFISSTLLEMSPRKYSEVVKSSVLNFLSFTTPDGYVPRTIGYDGVKDFPGHHKPFFFQMLSQMHSKGLSLDWLMAKHKGYEWKKTYTGLVQENDDPAFWSQEDYQKNLNLVGFKPLDRLEQYLEFYDVFRKVPDCGLYSWINIVESGIDTNLALRPRVFAPTGDVTKDTIFTSSPVPRIAAVDLNVYLYNEFKAASEVFKLLGEPSKADYYKQKASQIQEKFFSVFWDKKEQFFYNRYFKLDGSSELINVPSWIGFLPLSSDGLIDESTHPEISELIINEHILSDEGFMTPYGVRSMSRRSPVSGGVAPRALVPEHWFEAANWNGPIWVLTNIYAIEILNKYGYIEYASIVHRRMNYLLSKDITNNGCMHEQYSYVDGKPGWAEDFMSWNTLMWVLNS